MIHQKEYSSKNASPADFDTSKTPALILWAVGALFVLAVLVRGWSLGNYGINNDENIFHIRSAHFINSVLGPFAPSYMTFPKDYGNWLDTSVNLLHRNQGVISRRYPFTIRIDAVHPGAPASLLMGLSYLFLADGSSPWSLNAGSTVAATRLPNVIIGASLIPLLFWTTAPLLGWRPAFYAACLAAFNPWLVGYSREAQLDISAAVWATGAMLCYMKARQIPEKRRVAAICAGIFAGLAMTTNPFGFYIVPTMGVIKILLPKNKTNKEKGSAWIDSFMPDRTDTLALLSWMITFVMTYPNIWPNPALGVYEWFQIVSRLPHLQGGSRLGHLVYLIHGPIHVMPWVLVLVGVGSYSGLRSRNTTIRVLLLWVGSFILLLSLPAGYKDIKRLLFLLPAIMVLAGYGLDRAIQLFIKRWGFIPSKAVEYGATVAILLVSLGTTLWWWPYPETYTWRWLSDPQAWFMTPELSYGEGIYCGIEYIKTQEPPKARIACLSGVNNAAYFYDNSLIGDPPATIQEMKEIYDWLVVLPKYSFRVPPSNEVIRFARTNTPTHIIRHHQIELVRLFKLADIGK